jgi:hypothetical protein
MARQFVNMDAATTVKATIAAMGGDVSFAALKARLEADGNGALARDILNLHLAGVIPGIVRPQPVGRPLLFLRTDPVPASPAESAPVNAPGVSGSPVTPNPSVSVPTPTQKG